MTEDEAKTKWCPMSRSLDDGHGVNRGRRVEIDTGIDGCLGTGCMMWRWHQVKNEAFIPTSGMMSVSPAHPADVPKPWKDSDTDGYCGLAR